LYCTIGVFLLSIAKSFPEPPAQQGVFKAYKKTAL
ncbi:hypothetical protein ABIA69_004830, partial [Lysinibacillus parviboronicapiens]